MMPRLPAHGTMRRYRLKEGPCRCAKCIAKNTAEKKKERERRAEREGRSVAPRRTPRTRVPTFDSDPTDSSQVDGSVRGTLAAALAELVDGDDLLTVYRKAHALKLAGVLDDTTKPHLWRGITTSLHEVLALLIAAKPPSDGEADQLAQFMAQIGSTRGRGNPAPVHDAEEPGAADDRP